MRKVTADRPWPLHDVASLRRLEQVAASVLPAHALMERAGLAAARLALAVAPHARLAWVACGPGNNGGDGFEAALALHRWGKPVALTLCGDVAALPPDAAAAWARCRAVGLSLVAEPPPGWGLCLDALLGIGANRPVQGDLASVVSRINEAGRTVVSVDIPSGLGADTGHADHCVRAAHTATFLALKPGLFTGSGRDAAGQVWLDGLGCATSAPTAWLAGPPVRAARPHASHKGSHGDVAVIGGAPGMVGAAVLAAQAALHAGAGRVYLAPLDARMAQLVPAQPELMVRDVAVLALQDLAVACGCGGGSAIVDVLDRVLRDARSLVLDADALNAIAADERLQDLVRARAGLPTVLTPHPLEAARLLGTTTGEVQADRLRAAGALAARFACTVVLKGSGSVVACPGGLPWVNPTGNPLLATGGTGDVLAGLVAARLAAGLSPLDAACAAVYEHGALADAWPAGQALTAGALASRLQP